jgi:hypothetical protein
MPTKKIAYGQNEDRGCDSLVDKRGAELFYDSRYVGGTALTTISYPVSGMSGHTHRGKSQYSRIDPSMMRYAALVLAAEPETASVPQP